MRSCLDVNMRRTAGTCASSITSTSAASSGADRPREERQQAAVGQHQAAAQRFVDDVAQHQAQHERRHRKTAPAQPEAGDAHRQHHPHVEQPLRDRVRAQHAQHEDDGHDDLARHAQHPQHRPHQDQAEEQDRQRRHQRDADHVVDELRLVDHQHRAGLRAVDDHRCHQHRGRRRAGDAQGQRRDQRAGDGGVVAGLGGDQAVDRALAELLALACWHAWLRRRTTRPPCPRPHPAGCRRTRRSAPSG